MKPQKEYILVVNPISGDVDKSLIVETAKDFSLKENIRLIVFETSGIDDKTKLQNLYKKHLPERIIIAGGDGTIKMTAEALENQDVVLGILPAGSANGLSMDLGLPNNLEKNLQIAFHNPFIEMDMITINGKRSLHLSDIGINAELIKNYEKGNIRGKLGYALQGITTLTDHTPFRAIIETSNRTIETQAGMIVIANSQKYGTGVTINPNGVMNDGKFEIVIFKNLDLLVVGKILSGNMPIESGEVEIISTNKASVSTNIPVSFQIDGEYRGDVTNLEAEIMDKQIKVAVPE